MPVYYDDFNRTNEASLASPWTTGLGSGLQLINNEVCAALTDSDCGSFYNSPVSSQQYSQVIINTYTGNGDFGPCVRFSAGGNCYLFIIFSGQVAISRFTGGGYQYLTSLRSTGASPAAGDVMRIEAIGSSIRGYYNGVLIHNVLSTIHNTGYPGIFAFTSTARLDNWSGGDVFNAALVNNSGKHQFAIGTRGNTCSIR